MVVWQAVDIALESRCGERQKGELFIYLFFILVIFLGLYYTTSPIIHSLTGVDILHCPSDGTHDSGPPISH
jgi:hypothetical protein